jgi:hypothetical protein
MDACDANLQLNEDFMLDSSAWLWACRWQWATRFIHLLAIL